MRLDLRLAERWIKPNTSVLDLGCGDGELLNDMLRVGKQAIITFPNFAHWKTRSYLFLKGKMPVSEALPYSWYDTPNIHLCTFKDFEVLCQQLDIKILNRLAVDDDQQGSILMKRFPNLMGEVAIYRVSR